MGSSENVFPRSASLLIRNGADGRASLTFDVRAVDVEELASGDSFTDTLDDRGGLLLVSFDNGVSIEGADLVGLDFDRLPWFELGNTESRINDSFLAVITGEPGAEFTVSAR